MFLSGLSESMPELCRCAGYEPFRCAGLRRSLSGETFETLGRDSGQRSESVTLMRGLVDVRFSPGIEPTSGPVRPHRPRLRYIHLCDCATPLRNPPAAFPSSTQLSNTEILVSGSTSLTEAPSKFISTPSVPALASSSQLAALLYSMMVRPRMGGRDKYLWTLQR